MSAKKGEFRGRPTLTLSQGEDDVNGFTFGVWKAKLILANLPAIRRFVKEEA